MRRAILALATAAAVALGGLAADAPAAKHKPRCHRKASKHKRGHRPRCKKPKPKPKPKTPATPGSPAPSGPGPAAGGGAGGSGAVGSGGEAGGGGSSDSAPVVPPSNPGPIPGLPRRLGVDETEWRVTPSRTLVGAGDVEFNVTNFGEDDHDFSIRNAGGQITSVPIAAGSPAQAVTVNLAAGTYTLYCSLPGHEGLGMKAQLTVQ